MFGVDTTELAVVAVLALIFIASQGPAERDSHRRLLGRTGPRHGAAFPAGIENMVREAELEEMEKKWREENERIMREYPANPRTQKAEQARRRQCPAEEQPRFRWTPPGKSSAAVRDIDETKAPLIEHLIELGNGCSGAGVRGRTFFFVS